MKNTMSKHMKDFGHAAFQYDKENAPGLLERTQRLEIEDWYPGKPSQFIDDFMKNPENMKPINEKIMKNYGRADLTIKGVVVGAGIGVAVHNKNNKDQSTQGQDTQQPATQPHGKQSDWKGFLCTSSFVQPRCPMNMFVCGGVVPFV